MSRGDWVLEMGCLTHRNEDGAIVVPAWPQAASQARPGQAISGQAKPSSPSGLLGLAAWLGDLKAEAKPAGHGFASPDKNSFSCSFRFTFLQWRLSHHLILIVSPSLSHSLSA